LQLFLHAWSTRLIEEPRLENHIRVENGQ
jgi:hypothetical protein